jgi:hypothetical protein
MSTTIDPRIVDNVVQWADYMYPTIEIYGVGTRLMVESEWQQWAGGLLGLAPLARLNIPNAYQFTDWREWAMRFNDVINQGS